MNALGKELKLRSSEFKNTSVDTIYFGGGTPSLLSADELQLLLDSIFNDYAVAANPEITLEANPDDLSNTYIQVLGNSEINRLSIGIQSFFNEDLTLMNRAHNASEALRSLEEAKRYFNNISVDLIYGIPNANDTQWISNIERVLDFEIPHISAYALTVEPKTALAHFIKEGKYANVDDEQAERQFHLLVERLDQDGFINYEISNFGKEGYFSRNNSAYWQGKSYLGIGPSAHSFDGQRRGWNVRNNSKYIAALSKNELPIEYENLSKKDRYNEYVMTGLRTIWGISLKKVKEEFGPNFERYLEKQSKKYVDEHLLFMDGDTLRTSIKGRFLSDGIASDLFMINLE